MGFKDVNVLVPQPRTADGLGIKGIAWTKVGRKAPGQNQVAALTTTTRVKAPSTPAVCLVSHLLGALLHGAEMQHVLPLGNGKAV